MQTQARILPVEEADIPHLHQISIDAFKDDRHTLMKMYEKGSDDLGSELLPTEAIYGYLRSDKIIMKKAVIDQEIVGWTIWGKWNFDNSHPSEGKEDVPLEDTVTHPDYPSDPSLPLLIQLKNKTSSHLFGMQSRLNAPGRKCLYCIGITVSPHHQGKGVGKALISWIPAVADPVGALSWVHLSDAPGWRMFEKSGFRLVNSNVVDLDKYSAKKYNDDGKGIVWGIYTFRCMVREPGQERK